MVMVLFASVAAVPVHQPISNLTHRSSHHPPMSQAPQSLRPVVQLLNQSHNQSTQTFRHLTQALSAKKTTPTAPNKVEEYAKKLRADMEAQERVLNVFIKTIKDKHTNAQNNLKRANENLSNIKKLIVKYKNEIANATKYEDKYQTDETAQSKQSSLLSSEYQKAKKMYEDEAANIKFEKQFLEEIIKYIQLRKSNCLAK
jgi:DNA repair ATPase RecN